MGFSGIPQLHKKVVEVQTATSVEEVNELLAQGWDLFSTEPFMPEGLDETMKMMFKEPKLIFVLVKREA